MIDNRGRETFKIEDTTRSEATDNAAVRNKRCPDNGIFFFPSYLRRGRRVSRFIQTIRVISARKAQAKERDA